MAKRKAPAAEQGEGRNGDADEDSSDEDTEMINVDFEWFDPQEIDFHGLKLLLRQLFDVDHDLFDLSAISNLVLSQPLLGSTVKVPEDGVETKDTDPFAILTVLNLHTHREKPEIRKLTEYLAAKAKSMPSLTGLTELLSPASPAQIGLVLCERFINMPADIVPPMYKMLLEELEWAVEAKEPYEFSHYLVLSKTYTEVQSSLDATIVTANDPPPSKKSKKAKAAAEAAAAGKSDVFYFHPEDEIFARHALGSGSFLYTHQGSEGASDAKRTFSEAGIEPVGFLALIDGAKFGETVQAVADYINPS